jgi:hypothetical protein
MSHDTQRLATLYAAELADDLESWKDQHAEVQRCWEIEDRLTILKAFLNVVLRAEGRRREVFPLYEPPPDPALETRVKKSLRRLERVCAKIDRSIRWLEQRSYTVEGTSEFRRLWTILKLQVHECGRPRPRPIRVDPDGRLFEMTGEPIVIPGLGPEEVLERLADIEANPGRLLEEIIAERKR